MPIQVFNSDGTFTWPEDITHVRIQAWGGGGGGGVSSTGEGGGGGGAYSEIELYTAGESTLAVTVGAGGTAGNGGGHSKVVRTSTNVLLANGGTTGTGTSGGAGGGATSGVGTIKHDGGSGGNGQFGRGGGGGSSGGINPFAGGQGNDGEDAADPGIPLEDQNGRGGAAPAGGGSGGQGGDTDLDGANGEVPGGGAGGGATGNNGGTGGHGRVVFTWGQGFGHTRFSAGCCCSICDLTKGHFPTAVTLTFDVEPSVPEDFDPETYTVSDTTYIVNACTTVDEPTATGGDCDANIIDQGMMSLVGGSSLQLEMTDFVAGLGTYDGGAAYFCRGTYDCPLADPSIDDDAASPSVGFLVSNDRWCDIGTHPDPSYTSPTWSDALVCDLEQSECSVSEAYNWVRRGMVRAQGHATIELFKKVSDGTYHFVVATLTSYRCLLRVGHYSTVSSPTDTPTLDDFFTEDVAGVTSSVSGGPYDTGEEAIEAARVAIALLGPFTIFWTNDRGAPHVPMGPYYETYSCLVCDGFCTDTSNTLFFQCPPGNKISYSEFCGVSVSW